MDNQCSVHLGLILQAEMEQDVLSEAVELAKDADLTVVFVGNTTQWETEGQDLSSMDLPADGSQDNLISSVAAANPNTIVVNTTGVPVELPWLDKVSALIQAWYAGQKTGNAILDVLLGETSPSGKLPISWPVRYEHTGCHGNFGLDSYESREVEYVEGVYVGYRWFDKLWGSEKEVRFPFGHVLSYTQFDVKNAKVVDGAKEVVTVTTVVKNVGESAGEETLQVYVEPPADDGVIKKLVGFAKVDLQPGEERDVEVQFKKQDAAYWEESLDQWKVSKGIYGILIATSSAPKDVRARLEVVVDGDEKSRVNTAFV
ncbi:hypothetical protein P171DRAFT_211057 [Karstenula rhodostoma CBS 690.94]|uniref:beta-glucosidase n=1 Tax=Karstenula rhodostoma CBS 690.94 TaxID=1392251 RepID=A0A9P4UFB1_9PLEO|nr:hypothetical protein P171DRAFT_211057 [Karstenula rhodostoma CBS 690.94]